VRILAQRPGQGSDVEWVEGDLGTGAGIPEAVAGVDAIVQAATRLPAPNPVSKTPRTSWGPALLRVWAWIHFRPTPMAAVFRVPAAGSGATRIAEEAPAPFLRAFEAFVAGIVSLGDESPVGHLERGPGHV
jgi:hypothetical protein